MAPDVILRRRIVRHRRGDGAGGVGAATAMKQHSEAMLKYANDYIAKLYASRVQMATQEEGARETMHSVSRDLDA